jgi:hypothetical protein
MAILNPDHLLDQADRLVAAPTAGPPRQVDLRRAISSAYYSLFHATLIALADEFVGVSQRTTGRYVLVYRSVDHRTLKDICSEISRPKPSQKFAPYFPPNGFGPNIEAFALAAKDLQEKRHRADYNPEPRFKTSDAKLAIRTARTAISRFAGANAEARKGFLTLLLCPPR